MTERTTADDRARAQSVLGWDGVVFDSLTRDVQRDVLEVADALAKERQRARAPFLAVAERYDRWEASPKNDYMRGVCHGRQEVVDAIRAVEPPA